MTISKAAHDRLSADCDGLRAALTERTKQRDGLHGTIARLTEECEAARAEARRQIDRANELLSRSTTERQEHREHVDTLKRTIADLERDLADARGYARALNERLEHDSPLVEVPQAVRRADINRLRRDDPDRHYSAVTSIRDTERRPKHWTAV